MTAVGQPTRQALRSRDFAVLLVGRTVSTIASAVTWVLLPLHVYVTTGSAAASGLMSAMNVVPFLLFGLVAGAYVDRLRPRTIMVTVESISAAVLMLVPLVLMFGEPSYAAYLAIGFLASSAFVWYDVASSALVPAVVGNDGVFHANGRLWTAATIVNALAAPLGYLLLDVLGLAVTFILLGGIYVVSAGVISLLGAGRVAVTGGDRPQALSRADLFEGLKFVRRDRVVRTLTLAGCGMGISGGAVYSMIVVLADTSLGLDTDDTRVALLIAGSSLGALCASFVAPRLRRRDPLLVTFVLLTAEVILLVLYAWAPAWGAAVVLLLAWNAVHTVAMIVSISVRQERCPPELQGRVNAVGRMLAWGSVPLGAGIGGVLADAAGGASVALTVMALPVALAAVGVVAVVVRRSVPSPEREKGER